MASILRPQTAALAKTSSIVSGCWSGPPVAALVIVWKGLIVPALLGLLVYAWTCLLADRIVKANGVGGESAIAARGAFRSKTGSVCRSGVSNRAVILRSARSGDVGVVRGCVEAMPGHFRYALGRRCV